MFFFKRVRILVIAALAITSFVLSGNANESEKQEAAAEKYENGLGHISRAHEAVEKGDSLFAFNYRATSDSKARREYEKAILDFISVIELNPKLAEGYGKLGYCYRKIGKLKESLSSCDTAIMLNTQFEKAYQYRGETYLALDELAKAKDDLSWLTSMKSALADTLSRAIEIYKLEQIDKQMTGKSH